MTNALPDYKNLDLSGEALQAARRMEARAQAPASEAMFAQLVLPLLTPQVKSVCEFGCGTAALSRRIARAAPHASVYASDKSAGMLQAAHRLVDSEGLTNLALFPWDLLDPQAFAAAFPFPTAQFDLIISSVVIPYFEDAQAIPLIARLAAHLAPGGILAFVEQDWMSDMLNFPNFHLPQTILGKTQRKGKRTSGLGLRPVLREAGLHVLPRRSFLWTDDAYNPYTRDLLAQFASAALAQGQISPQDYERWNRALEELAASGDFFYGIVYHLIAAEAAR